MPKGNHTITFKEVFKKQNTDTDGLSETDVTARQKQYGPNALPKEKSLSWMIVLIRQFIGPLIIVLIVAGGVSLALHETVDAIVIFAAVFLNTIIGFVQEIKATRALESLQNLVHPSAVVRRKNQDMKIDSVDIVPGDILVLNAGDQVPADARLFEAIDLQANEAALTGESMPVKKQTKTIPQSTMLAEYNNMVFTGTSIVNGRGLAIVTSIGKDTQLGQIASLVKETKEIKTPLQIQLSHLAKRIAQIVVLLIVIIFTLGIIAGKEIFEMFELGVAIAVAAVPEGLVVGVTIILAIGMQRILRRKSIMRRLVAAETLGSVSVICTDKTGTITEGEMRVSDIVPLSGPVKANKISYTKSAKEIILMLEYGMLCNNAAVNTGENLEELEVTGSPTERALMDAGLQAGIQLDELRKSHQRISEIPFDSIKKYMVTLNKWDSENLMIVKGAPEKVIEMSSHAYEQGSSNRLTPQIKKDLEKTALKMTSQGLRLLALAYKPTATSKTSVNKKDLTDLVFLGFIGLRDPLRPGVKQEIREAKQAGVRTIVITGDHPNTALAIAREAGLITKTNQNVITGHQVDGMNLVELSTQIKKASVFARVEPKHKVMIVDALRANGEVIAMTGDGVNDAPALKNADIGIAVGSGTEVAKQASDMILLDNNIATITAAIEEGRVIFDNIRKVTVYLMADSFTEIILIGGALLMRLPLPLLPLQILYVNLFADSLPNAGLTLEPGEADIMKRGPRKKNEPVLNFETITLIFVIGIITDLILFAVYIWYLRETGDHALARTIAFAALGIDSLIYVFAIKSFERSIFRINPFSNLWLVGGVLIGFGLMALALLHPYLQKIFQVVPLRLSDWVLLIILGMVQLVLIEITKELFIVWRKRKKYAKKKISA